MNMITAFALINVRTGKEKSVYASLMEMEHVQGVRLTFGEFDLLARIETEDLKQLISAVLENIRTIDGVDKTSTLIATDED